jgi:hypothetical protein
LASGVSEIGKSSPNGGKHGAKSSALCIVLGSWLICLVKTRSTLNLKTEEDVSCKTGHERLLVYFLSLCICYVHSDEQTQLGRTADDIGTGTVVFFRLTQ